MRYADGFVIAFEREDDALRGHDVLPSVFLDSDEVPSREAAA